MSVQYKCLTCASLHGEPAENTTENWYWRMVENGRIGPFCRVSCSKAFRLSEEPLFTMTEAMRLLEVSYRTSGKVAS
jgi:hypothetical protein